MPLGGSPAAVDDLSSDPTQRSSESSGTSDSGSESASAGTPKSGGGDQSAAGTRRKSSPGSNASTAENDERGPRAAAARFGRSTLAASTANPNTVSTDPGFILANMALAGLLVLLILFPAHMFNSTLAENYDEVLGWFGPIERQLDKFRARRGTLPTSVVLGGMSVAGALLFGFLDPNFGMNMDSLALVLGLLASLVIVSCVYDIARARYLRTRYGVDSHVRSYPAGIVVATALVAISRLLHFTPGYLFGVFTALGFNREVDERDQGRGIAVASVWLLVTALACWLLWTPVSTAALAEHPGFAVLFLDAALSTTYIAGVQGLMFGLLPLRFLDGQKVLHWSRVGWGALVFLGVFAFVHTMGRPGRATPGKQTFWPLVVLFGGFTLASVAFWAYFRLRKPRHPKASSLEPPEGPDERELVNA